ncbi:MAG: ASKHA domain-containing protein [Candidatus Promineifilaceae bacterium]
MPSLTIIIGEQIHKAQVEDDALLGDAIIHLELPLEQPCAGLGTCGKCKVLSEGGLAAPDEIERKHLTQGELAVGNRLACRARISLDSTVVLAPIAVYSNKIFSSNFRYKRERDIPLGLAVDLGTTTVAAFLTMMDNGEVCRGGASLNQQAVYGADVISRLAAARDGQDDAERLGRLAVSSINQAIDSLKLSKRNRERIERVVVVGNPAMHHLLAKLPVDKLAVMPFQPYTVEQILDASYLLEGILPDRAQVSLPPLIGGFVGSDALACLAYFRFDEATAPMAAVDLGTNGEIMVTDGERILAASTAAGPAFEGVNISCGSRAVDGAVTRVTLEGKQLQLETIAGEPPVGLTGSGLLSAIKTLRQAGAIQSNGRISDDSWLVEHHAASGGRNARTIPLTPSGLLRLTQMDVRELQKAKGAIRAAIDTLMDILELQPDDLQRIILTGSFGGQVDVEAALEIGMLPPAPIEVVENIPNGAGFGAASFLSDDGFSRALRIAQSAEQIDLDTDAEFIDRFIASLSLMP